MGNQVNLDPLGSSSWIELDLADQLQSFLISYQSLLTVGLVISKVKRISIRYDFYRNVDLVT